MNDSIQSFTSSELHSSPRLRSSRHSTLILNQHSSQTISETSSSHSSRKKRPRPTEVVDSTASLKSIKKDEKASAKIAAREKAREKKDAEKAKVSKIKQESKLGERQVRGGYANEELGILMSPKFFLSDVGTAINIAVREANRGSFVIGTLQHKLENLILWERGIYVPTDIPFSSKKLVKDEGETNFDNASIEKFACVVLAGSTFVSLLAQHLQAIRFNDPKGGHIAHIRNMQKNLIEGSQLYIAVISLQEAIAEYFKKKGVKLTMTDAENASIQLYVATNVEITFCNSATEAGEFVERLSREVAERPYKMLPEALACVTKESLSSLAIEELDVSGKKDPKYVFWAMLQSLPGLAAKKATALVEEYPTIKSLLEAYEKPGLTLSQKEKLLENVLGTSTSKSTILSKQVYTWITTLNPDAAI